LFQCLARPLESSRGLGLPHRNLDTPDQRQIHPLQIKQVRAIVHNRDDHLPAVPRRFGVSRTSNLLRGIQSQHFLTGELWEFHEVSNYTSWRIMHRKYLIFIVSSALSWAALPDTLKLDSGQVSGIPGRSAEVRVFKGIPFAAPPIGTFRWRAPQPVP